MPVSGVGDAMAAPLNSQEVVHIKMSRNRSGKGNNLWGVPTKVLVDRQALLDYLTEYHHRNSNDKCKADGQDWPCSTYRTLREAVDE